jgi:2-phospho-L-lactate guanylyltransferase
MRQILVPCKSLVLGKSRLAGMLSQAEREALCRRFLADTLRTAMALEGVAGVKLVSTDTEAQALAERLGVETYAEAWPDLNAALAGVRQQILASHGRRDMLVLPIDLPLATPDSLRKVLGEAGDIVLVPDRKNAGTNILLLRATAPEDFRFAYGDDSFRVHCENAAAQGLKVSVLRDEKLAFDIDEPEDYLLWKSAQR